MRRVTIIHLLLYFLMFLVCNILSVEVNLKCKLIVHSEGKICSNSQITVSDKETSLKVINTNDESYEILLLKDTTIEFLPANISESFNDLISLKVQNSSLKEIQKSNFDGLDKLLELNLENNQIQAFDEDVFDLLLNLTKINLDKNNISALPPKVFLKNTKLIEISLIDNRIQSIDETTFKTLVNLEFLYISWNNLIDLRSGTFDNCPELKRIILNNNQLRYIPANIFKNNTKLKISPKNFMKNACIPTDAKFTKVEELNKIFLDYCKPLNHDLIEKLTKEVNDLKKSNEKINKELNALKEENKKLKEEHTKCKDDLREMDTKISDFENVKQTADEDLEKCNDETKNLTSQIEDLKQNLTESRKKESELVDSLKEANITIEDLNNKSLISETKYQHYKDDFVKCEQQKSSKFQEFENINNTLMELQVKIIGLNYEIDEKNKKIEQDKITVESSERKLREKDFTIALLFSGYERANATILQLQEGKILPTSPVSCITEPVKTEHFNIICSVQEKSYRFATSTYKFPTCTVAGLKKLDCASKFNEISSSDMSINGLSFVETFLTEFPQGISKKFKNLKYLEIAKSGFGRFHPDICGISSDFEFIVIHSSFIGESVKLDKCTSLKDLKIENSEVRDISTTNPINSLTNLIMKKNKIEKVSKELFEQFPNLRNVQMAGNRIKYLNGNVFDGNPGLEFVSLAENPISTINGEIFAKNSKLRLVDFKNLICISVHETKPDKIEAMKTNISLQCK